MEVKNPEVAILCNLEVLNLLKELERTAGDDQNYYNLLSEAIDYLKEPCQGQAEDNVRGFMKDLLSFPVQLTRTEKLMLVNIPPRSSLQLSLIIHNCDERLTEEQIEELLSIIEKHFPSATEQTEQEAEDSATEQTEQEAEDSATEQTEQEAEDSE